MKFILPLLTALVALPAYSAGMTSVPSSDGFCGQLHDDSSICYEWAISFDNSIRFIAYGYEDGVEYTFNRREPDGTYSTIVMIHPVLRDESRQGEFFWAYPWDILDIALPTSNDSNHLLASFNHSIVDDGEVYPPAWQKVVPAVLFIGRTTQPRMTVPQIPFAPRTLKSVRSEAGG